MTDETIRDAIGRVREVVRQDDIFDPDGDDSAVRRSDLRTLLAALDELAEVRAERDALLEKPISLAKMDSVDDDATDRMIAYYWHQQALEARAAVDAPVGDDMRERSASSK